MVVWSRRTATAAGASAGRRSRSPRLRSRCWLRPRKERSTWTSPPGRPARRSAICSPTPRGFPSRERSRSRSRERAGSIPTRASRCSPASSRAVRRCPSRTTSARRSSTRSGWPPRSSVRPRRASTGRWTTSSGSGGSCSTPTLVAPETLDEATTVQFPGLGGVIPGIGRFDPNDWGLGFELRDRKPGHWTGTQPSEGTFGHFGGSGTFLWVDPERRLAVAALTDLDFGALGARSVAPALGRCDLRARLKRQVTLCY